MHCPRNSNLYRLPMVGVDLPLLRLYMPAQDDLPEPGVQLAPARLVPVSNLPQMQWLNPGDPPEKRLSLQAAARLASYLLEDPAHERGAIVTISGRVVPFINGAPHQGVLVRMDDDQDFTQLVRLATAGLVWGWGHSHVDCAPLPSNIDIANHQFSFNMIIFSCADLTFGIYTAKEIATLAKRLTRYDQQ